MTFSYLYPVPLLQQLNRFCCHPIFTSLTYTCAAWEYMVPAELSDLHSSWYTIFCAKKKWEGGSTKQAAWACNSHRLYVYCLFYNKFWGCRITHSTKFLEHNTKFTYLWCVCCCITVTPTNCHFRILILSKHMWSEWNGLTFGRCCYDKLCIMSLANIIRKSLVSVGIFLWLLAKYYVNVWYATDMTSELYIPLLITTYHGTTSQTLRSALLRNITQRIVAIPYRCLRTTFLSHIQMSTRMPVTQVCSVYMERCGQC